MEDHKNVCVKQQYGKDIRGRPKATALNPDAFGLAQAILCELINSHIM
jgi:hypothetical protein